jgi:rod shape-determining protein MreD
MLPTSQRKFGGGRINREPSPLLAIGLPWVLVALGSMGPVLPFIANLPVMPPLGFLFFVAWLQMRPGLFPVWAGLPLGLFDDLFSGQPFGSAILLWSLVAMLLDFVEVRFPWRGFWQNWLLAAALTLAYLVFSALLASGFAGLKLLGPQIMLSILLYPLLGRVVGAVDRLRLVPFRKIG